MGAFFDLWTDYTLRNVALGCMALGIVSGVLGSYAVLRRQGLMGDALAHAALPGICLAFMLNGSKAPLVLMLGAALAGWAGMAVILVVLRHTRLDSGTALGTVLTTFFGLGVVLLTVVQKSADANQAGLDKFLFGQAAALVESHVLTMATLGGAALVVVGLLAKELKAISFDPQFSQVVGLPVPKLSALLTGLLVLAIVIGLNTVGVVLMSAMLVAPAAGARQWTHRLGPMIAISAAAGAGAGLIGAWMSASEPRVPTGPVIVLALTAFVVVSLLAAPARGWIWERARARRTA